MYIQIAKKLVGAAAGTVFWATNIGNEHGQVLVCVLTAAEDKWLAKMAQGPVHRYKMASQPPPKVMQVVRDCRSKYGDSKVASMFPGWPDMIVHLDIWHFMSRLARTCTTELYNQLYIVSMSKLSTCIFEWDPTDMAELRRAKRAVMEQEELGQMSEEDGIARITRRELELHCRRHTRGTDATTRLIQTLIDTMDSVMGRDTIGVPLRDHEKIRQEWSIQKQHVGCIQDPENENEIMVF